MTNPEQGPTRKKKEGPSRRGFLTGAASLAGLGMLGALKLQEEDSRERWGPEQGIEKVPSGEEAVEHPIRFLGLVEHPREYDTSELAGKAFGHPVSEYFGTRERLGPVTRVDFRYQLAHMWVEKEKKLSAGGKERPALLRSIDDIVMGYDPDNAMIMSAAYYYQELAESIRQIRAEVDWDKIHRTYHLSGKQNALLRSLEKNIDAKTLLAFNLSELIPSHGAPAFKVFDTLLKTAGCEFIMRIPSAGDNKMSFGPGQVTEEIFQETKGNRGSVAIMGDMLKRTMLTHDIASLRDRQHHMASYLDALFNLIRLVQKIPDQRATVLEREPIGDDVRLFISGAHNRPADAVASFERFASAYLVARAHGGHARPHFDTFCTKLIAPYVQRTKANLAEVRLQGALG